MSRREGLVHTPNTIETACVSVCVFVCGAVVPVFPPIFTFRFYIVHGFISKFIGLIHYVSFFFPKTNQKEVTFTTTTVWLLFEEFDFTTQKDANGNRRQHIIISVELKCRKKDYYESKAPPTQLWPYFWE